MEDLLPYFERELRYLRRFGHEFCDRYPGVAGRLRLAAAGRTRIVPLPQKPVSCSSGSRCPVSGIWQPWVRSTHPLQAIVNQYWRQAWLTEGQAFPLPERDWLLPLPETDITWHLMDAAGPALL